MAITEKAGDGFGTDGGLKKREMVLVTNYYPVGVFCMVLVF
jgi:hypothetical protein